MDVETRAFDLGEEVDVGEVEMHAGGEEGEGEFGVALDGAEGGFHEAELGAGAGEEGDVEGGAGGGRFRHGKKIRGQG